MLPREKLVLIAAEPPSYLPEMYTEETFSYFDRVYTWNDALVDNKKFFKFNYAVLLPMRTDVPPFSEKKLLTQVVGNKTSSHPDELYSERLKVIRYFESQPGNDFEFYGSGWDGLGFRNYKGRIDDKNKVLKNYRFCICYENIKNIKGYITEKIFDCFTAGCVPVYWGASNSKEYIPANCFIEREKFATFDQLVDYLKHMGEFEYNQYLANISKFLKSQKAQLFSREAFVNEMMKCALDSKKTSLNESQKPFLVLNSLKHELFSEFYMVLGFLDFCEKTSCAGMAVDFGKEGLYYDKKKGDNFWNYYFNPISIGNKQESHTVYFTKSEREGFSEYGRYQIPLQRLQELVKKYVHLRPALEKEVKRFCKDKFEKQFVIGVCYHRTENIPDTASLSYKQVYKAILLTIKRVKAQELLYRSKQKIKIFVATNELPLIDYLKSKFPGQIVTSRAIDSTGGVSYLSHQESPYKIGEADLLDCVLLSKCNFLLRMKSSLSQVSTLFNPSLRVKEL